MPVIDYEPPTATVPRCLPSSQAASPRARRHQPAPPLLAIPLSPRMRQAAAFADAALRLVLEVIDRRRPAAQLRSVLAPGLADAVLSASPAGQSGAAVLRRMRLQTAGGATPDAAAEVFGCYSRGDRVHAIACRVEQLPTPGRWLVVALHIG